MHVSFFLLYFAYMTAKDLKARLKLRNIFKGAGLSSHLYNKFINEGFLTPDEKAKIETAIHKEAKKILGWTFSGRGK